MTKIKIMEDSTPDNFFLIVKPFNDDNVTNGFGCTKKDLYELFSQLREIFDS